MNKLHYDYFLFNTARKLGLGCLCPVVVHNDYMVLDRHTHNTFTGITLQTQCITHQGITSENC
jgi:hypothetical protein